MHPASYRAVLFDLDGTLLQVQMHNFIPQYISAFHAYCRDLTSHQRLQTAMRAGIHLLLETEDGARTNQQRLFDFVAAQLELDVPLLGQRYADFLASDYEFLAPAIESLPLANALVNICTRAKIPVVLATNPVFPRQLIEARCRWAGVDLAAFDLVTSLENSCYCKPQLGYFYALAAHLGVEPQDCLMVGNDTSHDLAAGETGMTTWLVDTWIMVRKGLNFTPHFRGNHQQLYDFLHLHLPAKQDEI
ncbi:MAG: HAD family hydrolase [Deltaproteobacteria bacterium]|nr:HAD family hydrolase [Deltaproteobacteria bacterium]NCP02184.1 HAD family hydrolase [Deltaproteobacteria bacterium]